MNKYRRREKFNREKPNKQQTDQQKATLQNQKHELLA